MAELTRFGISLEKDLLDSFDRLCAGRDSPSRSEAIRDLIRNELRKSALSDPARPAIGALTLIYNHQHGGDFMQRLIDMQHQSHDCVLSTMHVHLDAHLCLEVLVLKGPAGELKILADRIGAVKGILHSALSLAGPFEAARGPEEAGHAHHHE